MKLNKIDYIITKNEDKLLPWQYYNKFNYITIPMIEKKVLIPNWQNKTKTVIPDYLTPNIGIITGKINNIIVLDIDYTDNGINCWNTIKKKYPEIITPIVKTPNGGLHYYFKYTNKIPSMNKILVNNQKIGWDIKSDKSIVVAPPSLDKNKRYKWINSLNDYKPIKMPDWLINFILSHLKESTKKRINN